MDLLGGRRSFLFFSPLSWGQIELNMFENLYTIANQHPQKDLKRIICLFPRNPRQKMVFRMIHGARIPWDQWAKIWSDCQCNHVWYLCQVSRVSFFGKKRDVTVGLRILGF